MIIVIFYTMAYRENDMLQPQFEVLKGLIEEEGAAQWAVRYGRSHMSSF